MKVGFISLIGIPNVGKSSLLNSLINYNLAITSPMKQTTRDQIKGIYNDDEAQIIFMDTPGIHKPENELGKSLNKVALKTLQDADLNLILWSVKDNPESIKYLIDKIDLEKSILVMTKIDLIDDFKTLNQCALDFKKIGFKTVVATSIKIPSSLNELINTIKEFLPNGHPFYDKEEISDVSLRFMAKEIIRKSIIINTFQEIPHKIAVVIDEFIEPDDSEGMITIKATIFVERDSQKGIIIGKQGQMLKSIGTKAREELIDLMDRKVHLELKIKVDKKWTKDEKKIKKLGY